MKHISRIQSTQENVRHSRHTVAAAAAAAADAESVAAACTGRHRLAFARPRPTLVVPDVSTSEEVVGTFPMVKEKRTWGPHAGRRVLNLDGFVQSS